jgi:hypothetical protein
MHFLVAKPGSVVLDIILTRAIRPKFLSRTSTSSSLFPEPSILVEAPTLLTVAMEFIPSRHSMEIQEASNLFKLKA